MCGIIFAANFEKKKEEPVNEWVVAQYQDQLKRGTQGFGMVFIQSNGSYKVAKACEQTKALMDLYHQDNQAPIILMHHRFPTSSENKMMETHPIEVDNGSLQYKYLMIHNGIIYSAAEAKKKHEDLGFVYTTARKRNNLYDEFNDSECLAIELARLIEKQTTQIEVNGSMAFVVLQVDKKENKIIKMFFGRNDDTPLNMSKTQNKLRLSSEGEGNNIEEMILYSCNLTDFKLKKEKFVIMKEDWSEVKKIYPVKNDIAKPQWSNNDPTFTLDGDDEDNPTTIEEFFSKLEELKEEKNDTLDNLIEQYQNNIQMIINVLKGDLMRYDDTVEIDEQSIKTALKEQIDKIMENAEVIIADHIASIETLKETITNKLNQQIFVLDKKDKKDKKDKEDKDKLTWHKATEDGIEDGIDEPANQSLTGLRSIHSYSLNNPLDHNNPHEDYQQKLLNKKHD